MNKKTLIFIGAGYTAALGMPTTTTQDKIFKTYFFANKLEDFIEINDKISGINAEKIWNLRKEKSQFYDVKKLIDYVNGFMSEDSFSMMALYNMLDMQINTEKHYTGKDGTDYSLRDAILIRKSMMVLLQAVFSCYSSKVVNNSQMKEYKEFFKEIAKLIVKEKSDFNLRDNSPLSEKFILAPVSYVCTNWDIFFLWPMFIAHKELNDDNRNYKCYKNASGIEKNLKLKIFNDFATFMAAEPISGKESLKRWFPYNESVAMHINDPDHLNDKLVTLIKTYLPHGQTNWLECPYCGKLSMFLGKAWELSSPSLIMNVPGSFESERPDKYKCLHCGKTLTTADTSMLLQTLYKKKPSYIQEIQTDMKLRLKEAERIIFIGYSLPDDDVDYRSMLMAAVAGRQKEIYLVEHMNGMKSEWLSCKEAKNLISRKICVNNSLKIDDISNSLAKHNELERYVNIFGENNVKVNFAGFPNAKDAVLDVLRT